MATAAVAGRSAAGASATAIKAASAGGTRARKTARGNGRRGRSGHIGGHDNNGSCGTQTHALAAQLLFVAKRQVDDPALAAAHRIKVKRRMGPLDFLSGGESAHAQFLHA
jgi:hypothetical protein